MIPTPPEKIPNTSESVSSRKNLNLPEKLPLPKNSITITERISNSRTKSQSLLKKSQPPKKFSTHLENVLILPENFTCNHPENLSKPLNNSQPPPPPPPPNIS